MKIPHPVTAGVAAAVVVGALAGVGIARAAIPDDDDALVYAGVLEDGGVPLTGPTDIEVKVQSGASVLCSGYFSRPTIELPNAAGTGSRAWETTTAGGDEAFDNRQASIALLYCKKA